MNIHRVDGQGGGQHRRVDAGGWSSGRRWEADPRDDRRERDLQTGLMESGWLAIVGLIDNDDNRYSGHIRHTEKEKKKDSFCP